MKDKKQNPIGEDVTFDDLSSVIKPRDAKEELDPCPFCDGEAKEEQTRGSYGGYNLKTVYCQSCGASAKKDAWNTRPTKTIDPKCVLDAESFSPDVQTGETPTTEVLRVRKPYQDRLKQADGYITRLIAKIREQEESAGFWGRSCARLQAKYNETKAECDDIHKEYQDLAGKFNKSQETVERSEKKSLDMAVDLITLAKPSADDPQFFNPMQVIYAKDVRDKILKGLKRKT